MLNFNDVSIDVVLSELSAVAGFKVLKIVRPMVEAGHRARGQVGDGEVDEERNTGEAHTDSQDQHQASDEFGCRRQADGHLREGNVKAGKVAARSLEVCQVLVAGTHVPVAPEQAKQQQDKGRGTFADRGKASIKRGAGRTRVGRLSSWTG